MTGPQFPLPDTDWAPAAPFWAAAATGRLSVPRCDTCDRLVWYPAEACRRCRGTEQTWVDLSGRGTLFSWAVVHQQFLPQYDPPYVTALVAVAEDPAVRMATRLVDVDPRAPGLTVDQAVEVTFGPLRFAGVDGEVIAPLWRPVAGP